MEYTAYDKGGSKIGEGTLVANVGAGKTMDLHFMLKPGTSYLDMEGTKASVDNNYTVYTYITKLPYYESDTIAPIKGISAKVTSFGLNPTRYSNDLVLNYTITNNTDFGVFPTFELLMYRDDQIIYTERLIGGYVMPGYEILPHTIMKDTVTISEEYYKRFEQDGGYAYDRCVIKLIGVSRAMNNND